MDIFNQPPSISEDTLQYTLYLPSHLTDKASATTLAVVMQGYADSLLPEMQWHRDTFQLKVAPDPDGAGFVLEGTIRTGDCVDDEWCAVWLLREISSKWEVAIRAFDSDGEFLLIEAADYLPPWVSPSNAENRVWIYGSHLHLVPLSFVSAPSNKRRRRVQQKGKDSDDEYDDFDQPESKDFLDAQDAIRHVRDPLTETRAPPEVEAAVWKRISKYPSAGRTHTHYTKAHLPRDIAKALAINPTLVQKAVETFYTRDALQLRAAHRMLRFPPEPSVLTTIRLTRTAYAQLIGQKFYPPKIFGTWRESENTPEWRWRDVGMKIASGFEMLYQESKGRPASDSSDNNLSVQSRMEALQRNPDFQTFVQNLTTADYFRGEREDSQLWKTLYDKAVSAFVEARRDDDANRPSFASQVNAAVVEAGDTDTVSARAEDTDEWLNVNMEDFDTMLQQTLGRSSQEDQAQSAQAEMKGDDAKKEEQLAQAQASRLQDLAKKVEDFVEGEGDLDGARFEDELSSDDDSSEDEDSQGSENESTTDTDTMNEEQRAARRETMDKLVPGIDPSEYGKMPAAYYSNSQKVTHSTLETEVREELSKSELPSRSTERRPIRPPILPRDQYDGVVDSDDETDEEDIDEDEEEQPQLVGDIEIDMEAEQDEFLEFARDALGVSDEQWHAILNERKSRGAFVPKQSSPESRAQQRTSDGPPTRHEHHSTATGSAVNPDLDSFEAVMQAMDAKLARTRSREKGVPPAKANSGERDTNMEAAESGDIEAAMEAELKAALEGGFDEEDVETTPGEESMDYNLIKSFLESFKSQEGLSGPVSNLVGRLQPGWTLPRDDS